jgi:hypothetical protein|tara:strand:+ start:960 stop:1085 length:126 start_codon:yes stop_codon:yes gene_type:complete
MAKKIEKKTGKAKLSAKTTGRGMKAAVKASGRQRPKRRAGK